MQLCYVKSWQCIASLLQVTHHHYLRITFAIWNNRINGLYIWTVVQEIIDLVSRQHYQIACQRYFEATHQTELDGGIQHPNQYFQESQKILSGDVKERSKGAHKVLFFTQNPVASMNLSIFNVAMCSNIELDLSFHHIRFNIFRSLLKYFYWQVPTTRATLTVKEEKPAVVDEMGSDDDHNYSTLDLWILNSYENVSLLSFD